jgi:hypothetical protein
VHVELEGPETLLLGEDDRAIDDDGHAVALIRQSVAER